MIDVWSKTVFATAACRPTARRRCAGTRGPRCRSVRGVVLARGRLDVVVEATVLVVGDRSAAFSPRPGSGRSRRRARARASGPHAGPTAGGRRSSLRARNERSMKFGSIHETAGRSPAAARSRKLRWPKHVLPVEVRGDRLGREPVLRVDDPEHRHVVVRVPAPRDLGVVEVAAERLEVVRPRRAAARRSAPPEVPADRVAAVRHRLARHASRTSGRRRRTGRRGRHRPEAAWPCGRPSPTPGESPL